MDKMTVYRSALALVDGKDYVENSATQDPLDLFYPQVLKYANARYNWSFTRAAKKLHKETSSPYSRSSAFKLPADVLNIQYIMDAAGRRVNTIQILGSQRLLVTEPATDITLVYTSDKIAVDQELPDTAPEFCQGVICLLAARIAPKIQGNAQNVAALEAMAEQEFMKALTRDTQQEASNDQNPIPAILSRRIW